MKKLLLSVLVIAGSMLATACVVRPINDCDVIENDVYVNGFYSHTDVETICYD